MGIRKLVGGLEGRRSIGKGPITTLRCCGTGILELGFIRYGYWQNSAKAVKRQIGP